jgi:predicted translin family RNA/ssDNA-binding protein
MHLPSSVSTLISQGVVSALHYNSVYLGGAAGLKNDEFSESAQGFVYTTEQSFQNKEKVSINFSVYIYIYIYKTQLLNN